MEDRANAPEGNGLRKLVRGQGVGRALRWGWMLDKLNWLFRLGSLNKPAGYGSGMTGRGNVRSDAKRNHCAREAERQRDPERKGHKQFPLM